MQRLRSLLAVGCAGVLAWSPAQAQFPAQAPVLATNADVFGRMAAACLGGLPLDSPLGGPTSGPVRLDVGAPYLRSALASALLDRRAVVVTGDTSAMRLALVPEVQAVAYARDGRTRLRRTATVRYRLTLVRGGRVLADRACADTASDVLPRRDRRRVEDAAWPETVGVGPEAGAWSRVLHTGIAAGAVVASTLLLFSLRSQ